MDATCKRCHRVKVFPAKETFVTPLLAAATRQTQPLGGQLDKKS